MGSHTWVRDTKKAGGGKTFAVGVAAVVPQAAAAPPAKKRKLIWQREDGVAAETDDKTGQPAPATSDSNLEKQKSGAASRTTAAIDADKKQRELEALKRQIEQRKIALEQNAEAAKLAVIAEQQAKAAERELRKRKLEAGFSSAFAAAKEAADADIAASRAPVSFADHVEVERVLAAGSDYGVLRLAPGADAASVRKRYRAMAVQLHPDKCKVARAGDAFHRLVQAYQQLSKYAK